MITRGIVEEAGGDESILLKLETGAATPYRSKVARGKVGATLICSFIYLRKG